jgi:hypothetical protein
MPMNGMGSIFSPPALSFIVSRNMKGEIHVAMQL